jgi:hypothetical protein
MVVIIIVTVVSKVMRYYFIFVIIIICYEFPSSTASLATLSVTEMLYQVRNLQ